MSVTVDSALNFPTELLNAPLANMQDDIASAQSDIVGLQGQIDNNTSDISSLASRMTTAELSISELVTDVDEITTDISNINAQLTAINITLSALNQKIVNLQNDVSVIDTTLGDHEARIGALEGNATVPTDPYVGALVHVRDNNGICQPAIVYEDWQAKNQKDLVSVVVVAPYRLSVSEWNSKIEVEKENGMIAEPFNTWHWPERYYAGKAIRTRL